MKENPLFKRYKLPRAIVQGVLSYIAIIFMITWDQPDDGSDKILLKISIAVALTVACVLLTIAAHTLTKEIKKLISSIKKSEPKKQEG